MQGPGMRARGRIARLALGLALACATAGAWADAATDARIAELERKLDEALKRIDALSRALGAAPAPAQGGGESVKQLSAKVKELEQEVAATANRPDDDHGLAVHGFTDVGFAGGSRGRPAGATLGNVDLYLTPHFGDRVRSLIEVNFEVGDGALAIDLERLQLGYTFADELTVWAGRFHTPYGYWNNAFHHGAQFQTSVTRPRFIDFEDAGGILPAHSVGLWGTGRMRTAAGHVGYDLYVANSPTLEMEDPAVAGTGILDPGLSGARDRSATAGANLHFRFGGALNGLTVGVHGLTSRVADNATIPSRTRLRLFGGWLTYLENEWEVVLETYEFRNRDLSGSSGKHSSRAAFVQLGRQFLGLVTPYVRLERASLDQSDSYFAQMASGQSYKRTVGGVRYELNPTVALKLEAAHTSLTDRVTGSYTEWRAQWAARF